MPVRRSTLAAAAALVTMAIATRAGADVMGHECRATRRVGGDTVVAALFVPPDRAQDYPNLNWQLADHQASRSRATLFVRFAKPADGAAPVIPVDVALEAFVSETPGAATDLVLSIGQITVQEPFYRPAVRDFVPAPGAGARLSFQDPAFLRAMASAGTVHVAFRQTDGAVLDETDLDLATRPAALEALNDAWREVQALTPDARTRCAEVTIDE